MEQKGDLLMSNNIFLRPIEYYNRELDPINDYLRQSSFFMSKMTGRQQEECRAELVTKLRNKTFPRVKNPRVNYYYRDEHRDRHQGETTLSDYLKSTIEDDEIIVPTFTTYVKPEVRKSLLVEFIDTNVEKRAAYRKEASIARTEGNMLRYAMRHNDQNNMKIYNNSMSGTFSAGGTALTNPTGHNTLTTIVRTMSSISNASNEKIISGNRHYYNTEVALNNINYIASSVDKEELSRVLTKYGIVIPTVEQTKECVRWSTQLYMNDDRLLTPIWNLIDKLDGLERAAVVYGGDLYHLRKYNERFVRDFIDQLSAKRSDVHFDNGLELIKSFDPMTRNYAHQVCMSEMKGKGSSYELLSQTELNTLNFVCTNIESFVVKHKDLIDILFLTRNIPASTAGIRNMVRRSVVLSDTDSTMFSIDEWVNWYYGDILFSDESYAKAGAVMYLATQCMAHNLAIMSANMGVETQKMFLCQMKPEYVFGPHFQTPVAKHYFCPKLVEGGDVFPEMQMEIKGVHLINSAISREIIKGAHKRMEWLSNEIMSNRKISITDSLTRLADLERRIINGIFAGEVEYFKTGQIKSADSYKLPPHQSPYAHYVHWRDVWAPKYGYPDEPPYGTVAIPMTIDKISLLAPWIEALEDKELQARVKQWVTTYKRKGITTVLFPYDIIASGGIPMELRSVVNVKKIVLDGTRAERMILATMGYHIKSNWLVSELGY